LNPRLHLNKELIMEQLMSTFTNRTYFNRLKQSHNEIEKALHSLGLNVESYRSLAKQMLTNYQLTRERKPLQAHAAELGAQYSQR
jgi:hypothetical protein